MGQESASPAPTETVLYSFEGSSDGAFPFAGLIADSSGNLYGTTAGGETSAGAVFKLSPHGIVTVLHAFAGGFDGAAPSAALIADGSGNLYGTTAEGGSGCYVYGCGVVFTISADGTSYAVLHAFEGGSGDGARPVAGLVAHSDGNLYGTTEVGGGSGCFGDGCGVVFRLSPDGASYTVLHSFTGGYNGGYDGGFPASEMIVDNSGNLYGTTRLGGAAGKGVVFRLSPDGTETVLYSFCSKSGCSDGNDPAGSLIADSNGNLYGTTLLGGGTPCGSGCGTVFKLSPDGTETVLHRFHPCIIDCSGASPHAGLIADSAGNLYGTTELGGDTSCSGGGCGVVFKLSADGIFTVLHSFTGFPNDGGYPSAPLIADRSGNLYGTTKYGGACALGGPIAGCGIIFKLTGTGFVVPVAFAGTPGKPNCHGQSVSALAKQYGGLEAAAAALGFPSVRALQDDIRAFCTGA